MKDETNTIDTTGLARELAALDGAEHQFDTLVTQFISNQRELASAQLMAKPGARPDDIERTLATMESGLEKLDGNLRCQYPEFLDVYVNFKLEKLSAEELSEYVATLREERVQRYFSKMRELQNESSLVTRKMVEKMIRIAMGQKG